MRILVICQYFYPEQFLINEIAPEFVKRGHEVTVITGTPNYPCGRVYTGYEPPNKKKEIIEGVNVIRCPIILRGTNKVQLLANYFSYMRLANKEAKKHDGEFDVVFLYQLTPILQAYPAIKYAQRNRKKLVCYCLDLAPASGNQVARWLKPMHFFYRRFSKWAYSNCDEIAVTSRDFIDYLKEVHDIPLRKLWYIPQHASEELLKSDLTKKNTDGITDFMFAGNLGIGARLDIVIYALEKIQKMGMKFRMHFVGDGRARPMLEKLTHELKMDDCIIFHGSVPISQMPEMFRLCDALIVSLRKNQITVPSKVQAYMATGKPIFGAMDGSGNTLINEVNCGRCVAAEDVHGLIKVLSDYITQPETYIHCGETGKKYFKENFTIDKYITNILQLIKSEPIR